MFPRQTTERGVQGKLCWGDRFGSLGSPRQLEFTEWSIREIDLHTERAPELCRGFTLILWLNTDYCLCMRKLGFPSGPDSKESACYAGDLGSAPALGRSPGEGNGNPLQYSCLENSLDRGTWQVTVHGVTQRWIQLSDWQTHEESSLGRRNNHWKRAEEITLKAHTGLGVVYVPQN